MGKKRKGLETLHAHDASSWIILETRKTHRDYLAKKWNEWSKRKSRVEKEKKT